MIHCQVPTTVSATSLHQQLVVKGNEIVTNQEQWPHQPLWTLASVHVNGSTVQERPAMSLCVLDWVFYTQL